MTHALAVLDGARTRGGTPGYGRPRAGRRRGDVGASRRRALPSRWITLFSVPATAFLALTRPLGTAVTIFPYGPADDWPSGRNLWLALLGAGLCLGVAGMTDLRWRRLRVPTGVGDRR